MDTKLRAGGPNKEESKGGNPKENGDLAPQLPGAGTEGVCWKEGGCVATHVSGFPPDVLA